MSMNATEAIKNSGAPEVVLRYREPLLSWISDKHLALLAPVVAYWIMSAFFHTLDTYDLLPRYRIHSPADRIKNNVVAPGVVFRAVVTQHLIQTAAGLVLEKFEDHDVTGHEAYEIWRLGQKYNVNEFIATLLFRVAIPFVRLFVAFFIIDTWQYMLHRFMHENRWAYRTMHSVHHRLYVPYAYGALYNSLLEGFLLDTLGTGVASLAVGLTDRENLILFVFSSIKTVDDHCGYELPWDPLQHMFPNRSTYHDIHHQFFGLKKNYSQPFFIMWDNLLGTKYDKTNAYVIENKRIREEKYQEKLAAQKKVKAE